ncbi:MAG: type II toxin-antitoxin system VapC family toxin [Candidatus Dormibacteraceae bacterium]
MIFFVDANVLIYSASSDPARANCQQIIEAIADGGVEGRTSTACLEEVWHLERSGRSGPLAGLTKRVYRTFTPLLPVTDATFARALSIEAPKLGTNDRLHVATCLEHGIHVICTGDAEFDGVSEIRRVDPRDDPAVKALLAGRA